VATGEVITTIEVLSPTNKRTGIGRNTYKAKRQAVLGSRTHLVEIDLLRDGVGMDVVGALPASDYRILVSKSDDRPKGWLYAFDLTQPIPVIAIPLRSGEADIRLDVQELLNRVYEQARFGLSIDYSKPPEPPLREDLQDWAAGLIQG
jgi:Protein of unknown function (DUF4058)